MIEVVLSFMVQTDQGTILISNPKDVISVCTTEFGAVAQLAPALEALHERDWRCQMTARLRTQFLSLDTSSVRLVCANASPKRRCDACKLDVGLGCDYSDGCFSEDAIANFGSSETVLP